MRHLTDRDARYEKHADRALALLVELLSMCACVCYAVLCWATV